MKLPFGMLLALTLGPGANAAHVEICNLNTAYGYEIDARQVRVTNERGQVLTLSAGGLLLDGRALPAAGVDAAEVARLDAALRRAIPAAVDVSRLSYELSLSGLARDFYSRHREDRWVGPVRAYHAAMIERFDARIQATPAAIAIQRGALSALGDDLIRVSRAGLSVQDLQGLPPRDAGGASVADERAGLDARAQGQAMPETAAGLCRHVRALAEVEARVFGKTPGLAGAFRMARTGKL
jgi:hypothetical protein